MYKTPSFSVSAFFTPLAIIVAYLASSYTPFQYYALQIFCLGVVTFLIFRRAKKMKLWHVLPRESSIEIALMSFSFLFVTGSTGATHSPFFSLCFVLLFFLIFSEDVTRSIVDIVGVILFYIALEPEIGTSEISTLSSICIIALLLFFAKRQYDQSKIKDVLLESEGKILDKKTLQEETLEIFTKNFLRPKLHFISTLLDSPERDHETAEHQIKLTITEVDKILGRVTAVENTAKKDSKATVSNDETEKI